MGLFEQFPYTNFQEKNLDHIAGKLGDLDRAVDASQTSAEASAASSEIAQVASAEAQAHAADAAQSAQTAEEAAQRSETAATESETSAMHAENFLNELRDEVPPAVSDWLASHITNPQSPPLDTSLSVTGAAADAGAVGTAIWGSRSHTFNPEVKLRWSTSGERDVHNIPPNSCNYASFEQIKNSFTDWHGLNFTDTSYLYYEKIAINPTGSVYLLNFIAYSPNVRFSIWHWSATSEIWNILTEKSALDTIIYGDRDTSLSPEIKLRWSTSGERDVHDMPLNSCGYAFYGDIKGTFSNWRDVILSDNDLVYYEKLQLTAAGSAYLLNFIALATGDTSYVVKKWSVWHNADSSELWYVDRNFEYYEQLRIAMLGDSITAGTDGSTGTITPYGYPHWIARLNHNLNITNLGVGSSGWLTTQFGKQNALDYVSTIDWSQYDVVTMCWGINDYDVPWGAINDTGTTTVCGMIYNVLSYLKSQNTDIVPIILGIPWTRYSGGSFPTWATWDENNNDLIKQICAKYHVHYINMRNWCNSWNIPTWIGDYVHPTVTGYEHMGRYVYGQLKGILGI